MTQDQTDSYVTNPPAFPRPLSKLTSEEVSHDQEGMTLRDYFAAAALATTACNSQIYDCEREHSEMTPNRREIARSNHIVGIASRAYQIADAMLAERQKAGAA